MQSQHFTVDFDCVFLQLLVIRNTVSIPVISIIYDIHQRNVWSFGEKLCNFVLSFVNIKYVTTCSQRFVKWLSVAHEQCHRQQAN